jgi:hypothetical protein
MAHRNRRYGEDVVLKMIEMCDKPPPHIKSLAFKTSISLSCLEISIFLRHLLEQLKNADWDKLYSIRTESTHILPPH